MSKKLNRCAWCGTWSPLQRPVFAHTAQQVAPSLQEHHIAQVLPDPEVNDDGAIDEVITDESDDEESPLANLPVTRGAFINSYSEANRVVGTFSSIPDLVAAVAVSWTSCEAVQPLLSKAVMANGGHVDGFTVIPNPPEAVAPTAPTAIFGGGITGETIIEGSGVYGGGTFEDSFTWLDELLSDHWLQQAIESVQWCRKSATDLNVNDIPVATRHSGTPLLCPDGGLSLSRDRAADLESQRLQAQHDTSHRYEVPPLFCPPSEPAPPHVPSDHECKQQ